MKLIPILSISVLLSLAAPPETAGPVEPGTLGNWGTREPQPAPACKEWQACRQLALEAADRQDYDAFHDLAWRAFNAGPRNSPELMALLARAQSLAGRSGDALVMLQRLAALGVSTDAATSEDFAGVRALPGWADLEAKLAGKPLTPAPVPRNELSPVTADKPDSKAPKPETPPAAATPVVKAETKPGSEKPAPPGRTASSKPSRNAKAAASPPVPLAFSSVGIDVVGLAYDAVSGRFIVGDARERRLLVLGERSGRVSSLAGIDAGFNEIGALEIDAGEGDLWVVSTSSESQTATVHKLQLISGRVLSAIPLPPELGTGRLADVAVTPQSVLVLDAAGRRILRVAKKGKTLETAVRLPTSQVTSLAPAPDGIAYAAFDGGLLRIDLAAKSMSVVEPAQRVDVNRLSWVRWLRGSLVGLQKDAGGAMRAVRIRLDDSGRSARALDVLDEGWVAAGPTSAALVGSTLHYLIRKSGSDEVEVRKLIVK